MNTIKNNSKNNAPRIKRVNTMALTACSLLVAASTAQAYYQDAIYGSGNNSQYGDWFGASFVEVEDLNRDGVNDYVVGSPGWSSGRGRVEVVSGKSIIEVDRGTRQQTIVLWSQNGMSTGDRFGATVATQTVGSATRIAVGAPGANGNRGYVQFLTSTGGVQRTICGSTSGEQFGAAISTCVNLGGSSAMDWAIGCPGGRGKVKFYIDGTFTKFGEKSGIGSSDHFGFAIDGTTDYDGDRIPDLLVGAPGYMNNQGAAYVLSGRNLDATLWSMYGLRTGDRFGAAVSKAGDIVNSDGISEVLIGIPDADVSGFVDCGAAMVFSLQSSRPQSAVHYFRGWANGERFGFSVRGGGRFNSDNLDDYVVGAPGARNGGDNAGAF